MCACLAKYRQGAGDPSLSIIFELRRRTFDNIANYVMSCISKFHLVKIGRRTRGDGAAAARVLRREGNSMGSK